MAYRPGVTHGSLSEQNSWKNVLSWPILRTQRTKHRMCTIWSELARLDTRKSQNTRTHYTLELYIVHTMSSCISLACDFYCRIEIMSLAWTLRMEMGKVSLSNINWRLTKLIWDDKTSTYANTSNCLVALKTKSVHDSKGKLGLNKRWMEFFPP